MAKKLKSKANNKKKENSVEPDRWEVYVATPAYDGKTDTDYTLSLAESAYACPLYQVKFVTGLMANGAFIDLARNNFVRMFLNDNPEATHLFFIDADLKFPAKAFVGLIRAGLPICAGVYRRREKLEAYPAVLSEHPELGGMWVEDGWVMCDRVPAGFLCISREVIEEMSAEATQLKLYGVDDPVPELFYTKIDDNRFIGEDFCFCDDYIKKYNKPIPVWADIDFTHGGYEGNFLTYLEKGIEENDKSENN